MAAKVARAISKFVAAYFTRSLADGGNGGLLPHGLHRSQRPAGHFTKASAART